MGKVSEVLGKDDHVVSPATPVSEVARLMAQHRMAVMPVCENGKFKGVITNQQIISRTVALGQNPRQQRAASLMVTDMPRTTPGADLMEAAQVMAKHALWYLPVVHNGKFIGIVSIDDLAKSSLAAAAVVIAHSHGDDERVRVRAPIKAGSMWREAEPV